MKKKIFLLIKWPKQHVYFAIIEPLLFASNFSYYIGMTESMKKHETSNFSLLLVKNF